MHTVSPATICLHVDGMSCAHCEKAVQRAILAVDAQAQTHIDRASARAHINTTASAQALCAAIAQQGYTARLA